MYLACLNVLLGETICFANVLSSSEEASWLKIHGVFLMIPHCWETGSLLWCFVAEVVLEELTGNLLFLSQKAAEKVTVSIWAPFLLRTVNQKLHKTYKPRF